MEIDNGATERANRDIALGRGNWTFFGSDGGGKTAAVLRSFIASCKRCGVEPFAWFRDVLSRIPAHSITRLSELLPHNWKPLTSPASSLSIRRYHKSRTIRDAVHETLTVIEVYALSDLFEIFGRVFLRSKQLPAWSILDQFLSSGDLERSLRAVAVAESAEVNRRMKSAMCLSSRQSSWLY